MVQDTVEVLCADETCLWGPTSRHIQKIKKNDSTYSCKNTLTHGQSSPARPCANFKHRFYNLHSGFISKTSSQALQAFTHFTSFNRKHGWLKHRPDLEKIHTVANSNHYVNLCKICKVVKIIQTRSIRPTNSLMSVNSSGADLWSIDLVNRFTCPCRHVKFRTKTTQTNWLTGA